ncbi:nucleolar and coiled-body phosphoprotein 1 [Triticum aestivum]|uniref:nucleolar and coiled-body phosphoprotein 1 n=1 Tax=Triticum aestivum TaxID=4565 RepID=UPI001D00572A|nr:nucleolar and coiled-body phosphoprotein 1-like [Triticum aestivum]
MAPKRAAKKPAPPPPPPAASSEEEDSRSRSEEEEDEDAESPPPAPTPAPKSTPAPPQEGEEEEEEESEEEDEEEESDEEPARASPAPAATPKNKPPPPQQGGDSDSSDEEEEEEPTKTAPRSAPKKQPPPPPPRQGEESDASDEEEEEGESEEEAPPPPKLAPKQAPEGRKPQAAAETKKPAAFSRIWSTDDEVRILEALADHQKQHGTLPQPDALVDALAGKLDNRAYGSKELQGKVLALRRRYLALSKKGELPSKEHDRRVLELSKMVWEGGDMVTAAAASANSAKAANGQEPKGFEEMCDLYPYLAEHVKELDAANPGIFKRQFGMMDEDKARAMDEKIKRQRVAQMKVELRRHDLVREVTKAIIDLVD